MSWDEEYSSSLEPFLNLREIGVTAIEHPEELTAESAAINLLHLGLPQLAAARTLFSDENESEDNVDPEQEATDEDSPQCGMTINSDECPDEQRGYEWSDEENCAGL